MIIIIIRNLNHNHSHTSHGIIIICIIMVQKSALINNSKQGLWCCSTFAPKNARKVRVSKVKLRSARCARSPASRSFRDLGVVGWVWGCSQGLGLRSLGFRARGKDREGEKDRERERERERESDNLVNKPGSQARSSPTSASTTGHRHSIMTGWQSVLQTSSPSPFNLPRESRCSQSFSGKHCSFQSGWGSQQRLVCLR